MHLQVLASGSRGNATLVRAGETHALVDCGLPVTELGARFAAARYEPRGHLGHILLSHGHLDHARSAGILSKRTGATVHCAERLMKNRSVVRAKRLATLPIGQETTLESSLERAHRAVNETAGVPAAEQAASAHDALRVRSVHLPHDADPTVAFRLEHAGRVAVVATDIGWPRPECARALRGAHVLVLEFNYDAELLAAGPYKDALKKRIASDHGHLSNTQAAEMLAMMAGPELHTLVLAHLSEPNNRPLYALGAARDTLSRLGLDHVQCLVASQDAIGPNLEV